MLIDLKYMTIIKIYLYVVCTKSPQSSYKLVQCSLHQVTTEFIQTSTV